MYGSRTTPVGYYCDACWEQMTSRKKRFSGVLVAVGVVLLITNILGLYMFKSATNMPLRTAPIAVGIVILGLLVAVASITLKRK
jgi:hypothetical protein